MESIRLQLPNYQVVGGRDVAFHGKDLSFMDQIKTGSEKLHTESNLCSNSPSFRKFQTGRKLTMVSQ